MTLVIFSGGSPSKVFLGVFTILLALGVLQICVVVYVPSPRSLEATLWNATQNIHNYVPVISSLEVLSTRFYIYEQESITRARAVQELREGHQGTASKFGHLGNDIQGEQLILKALENHPLRTFNAGEAEIFIVPTPASELLAYGCQWEDCTWYDEAFGALSEHPIFVKHEGHNHVIIAQSWALFNKRYSAYVPALSRNYRLIENVTVAHNYDPFGCVELSENETAVKSDFNSLFEDERPVTNAFSVGLGYHCPFDIHPMSLEAFDSSKYFLFYHPRNSTFGYRSTKYREAPLNEKVIEALPLSSIGHDVEKQEWVEGITSSKFCLVVRGDTPHSHSLNMAVRAGCIPVIVSDYYQTYAGPFKASISTNDFAIYIKESSFLESPLEELQKLQDLPRGLLENKLEHLSIAQRVMFPDHSQSFFVEAFIKEVVAARRNVLPQAATRVPVLVHKDHVTISERRFEYRYPSTLPLISNAIKSGDDAPTIVVGVLSAPENFNARHSIRETWASKHEGRVFFLVAGQWESPVVDEFEVFGDLFWLGMEEDYDSITYKVQAFLHAIDTHLDSYDYVLKTDDDSYIFLDDVKKHLKQHSPKYWGCCFEHTKPKRDSSHLWYMSREMWPDDFYPPYASGIGYAVSHDFVKCAASHLASSKFMKMEDVATGLLAQRCGVTCRNDEWVTKDKCFVPDHDFVEHRMYGPDMIHKHWAILKARKLGEWIE